MIDPLAQLDDDAQDKLEKRGVPDWVEPMLATLTHDPFSDPDWIYDRKFDGERVLAYRDGGAVQLYSRNQESLNATYPEVRDALAAQGPDRFVVDGEMVTFDGDVTSFSKLQTRMKIDDEDEARASDVPVYFYLFDVMHVGDYSTEPLSQRDRKAVLRRAFDFDDPLRFADHRNEDGLDYLDEACEKGWEGLIAKDATAPYVHSRSKKWLKFKCVNRQEFVIAGWTDPEGERIGFGALLIGYYDDDDLRYAGMVGTGFDDEFLSEFSEKLKNAERQTCPFDAGDPPTGRSDVHWASPTFVGECGFTEWTDDARLRHPRFVGLRRDKDPEDVVREG